MKRKLALILMTTAIMASVIFPTMVLADDQETITDVRPIKDGLAIVAPRAVAVGNEFSLTVFQCSDQTPVPQVGIWVIEPDRLDTFKGEASKLKENKQANDTDYQNLLDIHGTFLGLTDPSGKMWHTFNNGGRYTLVAFIPGYWPDARPIAAITASTVIPRLVIDAPDRIEAGEKITITITDRANQEPVKDAGVWALSRDTAESLKAELGNQTDDKEALADYLENTLDINGIFLGDTNGAGKVQYAFDEDGGYLLVTFKRGYLPGFKPLLVKNLPKVLAIDAPNRAQVDEKITITVFDRNTQDAVKDAGVWAVTRESAGLLKSEMAEARTSGDPTVIQNQLESSLNAVGFFLGTTNGAGKVQYAFEQAGGYLLVTFKPGYWPGIKPIFIVDNTPSTSAGNASIDIQ